MTTNQSSRFVRCYGHVLTLVVKVFLYGKKSPLLTSKEGKKNIEKENQEIERWRKIGLLGKLRNITVWIQGSSQWREAFSQNVNQMLGKTTQTREMILENVTCWTEDFDALA